MRRQRFRRHCATTDHEHLFGAVSGAVKGQLMSSRAPIYLAFDALGEWPSRIHTHARARAPVRWYPLMTFASTEQQQALVCARTRE